MTRKLISLLLALMLLCSVYPAAAAQSSIELLAYSTQDGSHIMLLWDDAAAGRYTIQRKVAGSSSYTTLSSGRSGNEYRDTSPSADKVYLYRVKNETTGTYSNEAVAKTMVGVSQLKATRSGSKVTLNWTAGKRCDGYEVTHSYGSWLNDDIKDESKTTTGTSCTFEVETGTQNMFYVVPYADTSYGRCYGNDETGVPMVRLATPQLTLSKSDGKVKLQWDAVKSATKYYIYRGTSSDNLQYYDTTTKTSYTNSSVTSGTRYYYQVKAVSVFYEQEFTGSKSTSKSTIPLATPQLKAVMSAGAAKLSWNAVTGASKYYIYRGTSSDNLQYYDTTTKTSYTNTSVQAGSTYYYKVKAIKPGNSSDWTSDYSAVRHVKILRVPTITLAKNENNITVSWNAVDGAAKYYLYRSVDGGSFSYYDTTSKTSYTNSAVSSGSQYSYQVKAVDQNGGATLASAAASTVFVAAPRITSYTASVGQVSLQWERVSNAGKYWIYRSVDGKTPQYYDATTKTSYSNLSVTPDTTYTYYIKAVVTRNNADWSSSPSQTIKATVPIG